MIKLFESFKEIKDICEEYGIENYTINSDGSIDVDGEVILSSIDLKKIPLTFNRVTRDFRCCDNNLISLEGAPRKVSGDFICYDNLLTSIEGSPQEVGGNFYCSDNLLTSLKGGPKRVSGIFNCHRNKIWTFEGAPDYVGELFLCSDRNTIYNIWKLFEDYSKIELFNYYDIIREVKGKPAVVLDRLNDFLEEIGKDPVEKVDGYINI